MRRWIGTALLLLAAATVALPAAAQAWRHEVRSFPPEVIEGQALKFEVAYAAAEPEKLHAEVKDAQNVVHVTDVRTVSGTGVARFSIAIPPDRFKGQLLVAVWFGENWQQPRAPIIHVGPIPVWTAEEGRRIEANARSAASRIAQLGLSEKRPAIGVLSGGWGGRSAALPRQYAQALAATGRRVVLLSPDDVTSRQILNKRLVTMLVVPEARTFPGPAVSTLSSYLRAGGHMIAMGAPAFDRLVRQMPAGMPHAGEWLDEWQVGEVLRATPATASLIDAATMQEADWRRSTNDTTYEASHAIEDVAGVGRALHVKISNLTGWETLATTLARPAAATDNVVTFRARGSAATTALSIELTEADGSRWIAVTPLAPKWQRYVLAVGAFVLWDPDHKSGRGGPGDKLDLTRIRTMAVGLAFTHTSVGGGKHEYWFAEPGVGKASDLPRYTSPTLDTFSPAYKVYPVRGATRIDASRSKDLFACEPPSLPKHVLSTHPRTEGTGYLKARKWRWVPLLQVTGKQGVAGTIATLLCHRDDEFAGGRWASFTAAEPEWYARPDVRRYVVALAKRMLDPDMLHEGGAEYFGAFPDDKMRVGAVAAEGSRSELLADIRVEALGPGATQPVYHTTRPLSRAGANLACEATWAAGNLTANRYRVTTVLLRNGKPIDRLSHEITVRSASRPGRVTDWITAKDGQFQLSGKPWYPHGVNYMPSSGIAIEAGHYFEQWLSTESYDPVVIERDLARCQQIGFNMISAFVYIESMHNRNLIDLLNRCDAHGLRVNLSLRPGTPLDFEWPGIGDIIKANHLADDPTVFAYDLAWESVWGFRDARVRWDGEWERWVVDHYGSVEAAEQDWGRPIPRVGGKVAGASDAEVLATGPDRMVAAYRRFLDDLLSRKHLEARQKIHTVDARHLLSFRMSEGGNPTCGAHLMGYDYTGLARDMDFVSPEGYGRIGDWEKVKPGWFTVPYARLTAPGHPVLWAEFGYTIWNRGADIAEPASASPEDALDRRFYQPETIAFTENYYRCFFDMALKSGSAGTVCWWYPGGYRFGENSDFGIINPDGTWRGLTRIIAEYAKKFAARPLPPQPDAFIQVDRDAHADGLFGIYTQAQDEFWKLIAQGKTPGLRADGDGTDSATAPRVAVGNVPITGSNPPKHLNAEFDSLQVRNADGQWQDVPYEGATVTVKAGEPIRIRGVAGNTGKAAWLPSSAGVGPVVLIARCRNAMAAGGNGDALGIGPLEASVQPLGTSDTMVAEMPALPDGARIRVEMTLRGVSGFGEVRWVTVRVR